MVYHLLAFLVNTNNGLSFTCLFSKQEQWFIIYCLFSKHEQWFIIYLPL